MVKGTDCTGICKNIVESGVKHHQTNKQTLPGFSISSHFYLPSQKCI
jgi:hypothetical protein